MAVPGFGSYLSWVGGHAIVFASGCAAAVLLVCLPWRRRRLSPVLVAALAGATRESRRQGRTPGEYAALGVAGVASLAALGVVGLLAATHQLTTSRGAVGLVALGWSAGCLLFLVLRLFDGRGLPEPTRSLYALSGRLRRVERFPALEEAPAEVVSAVALRAVAERDRLPVLHVADPSGRSHEFLVVTARRGSYRWCCQVDAGTA